MELDGEIERIDVEGERTGVKANDDRSTHFFRMVRISAGEGKDFC